MYYPLFEYLQLLCRALCNMHKNSTCLTTICVNVRDRVVCCLLSVCVLSPAEPLEVWKHEWYHVVTNCQGHVLSPSGLPKVAKKHQKKPKFAFPHKYSQDPIE